MQFRVLCRPGLLIEQHSFLFLFLFPLFLPFLLFSSFIFFSFPPFLLSFPPFLFSFLPPSLFPSSSFSLWLSPRTEIELSLLLQISHVKPPYIGFKRAMHVDTWHAICHICMPFPCIVTHGLPCVARHSLPQNT